QALAVVESPVQFRSRTPAENGRLPVEPGEIQMSEQFFSRPRSRALRRLGACERVQGEVERKQGRRRREFEQRPGFDRDVRAGLSNGFGQVGAGGFDVLLWPD